MRTNEGYTETEKDAMNTILDVLEKLAKNAGDERYMMCYMSTLAFSVIANLYGADINVMNETITRFGQELQGFAKKYEKDYL